MYKYVFPEISSVAVAIFVLSRVHAQYNIYHMNAFTLNNAVCD